MGATDEVEEGTWVWVSGEAFEYTSENPFQTDEGRDEDYLILSGPESPGYWNDQPAEKAVPFVCEWDPFPQGKAITVTSAEDSGAGTLRQALLDAQAGDTITFDPEIFPPDRPTTIFLTSVPQDNASLPRISQGGITIDASNAGVILDGSKLQGDSRLGLVISSDHNTVMGLKIINYSGIAIYLEGGSYNRIGGDRTIGAGPFGQGNLLSNNYIGISILSMAGGNIITGNLIGTDASGAVSMGNWKFGIQIEDQQSYHPAPNIIGPDNVIAYNGSRADVASGDIAGGVGMDTADTAMTITGNSIYDNAGPGIYYNLDDAMRTKYATPPVILYFDLDSGVVNGQACIDCIVEIFSTETQDGKIYEGTVTADEFGNFSFSKGEALTGPYLTATATLAPDGNTSEFSQPTSALSAIQIALDAIQNEAPLYQTSFDTWEFGDPVENATIENGKLILTSENQGGAGINLSNLSSDMYAVEFEFRILESAPPDSHCVFETGNDGAGESSRGKSAVFFFDGTAILADTDTNTVENIAESRYDETRSNRVTLIILGDQIAAFVNGQLAYTALDPHGSAVYTHQRFSAYWSIVCEIDNYKYWDLSGVDFSASTLLTTLVPNFADPILAAIKDRAPDFQDDFSVNNGTWVGSKSLVRVESGVLRSSNNNRFKSSFFINKPNFVLQVDVGPSKCCTWVMANNSNIIYLTAEVWGIGWSYADPTGYPLAWGTTKKQVIVIVKGTRVAFYLEGIPRGYSDHSGFSGGEAGFMCSEDTCEFNNVKFWDLDNVPNLP